jgi:DNA-binding transcriptional regulator GbsR (MarR family)
MGNGYVPKVSDSGVGVSIAGSPWFTEAISVVGDVIGFWGFKENHGRIWALLYLHQRPINTTEIRESLNLSKGAASMLLSDLESWSVIIRDVTVSERGRYYIANPNFIEMIVQVMKRREADIIDHTSARLESVIIQAEQGDASSEQVEALQKMGDLAHVMKLLITVGQKLQSRSISDLSNFLHTVDQLL